MYHVQNHSFFQNQRNITFIGYPFWNRSCVHVYTPEHIPKGFKVLCVYYEDKIFKTSGFFSTINESNLSRSVFTCIHSIPVPKSGFSIYDNRATILFRGIFSSALIRKSLQFGEDRRYMYGIA